MLPWALRDRSVRFLTAVGIVLAIGLGIETFFIPHYLAPATALIYAILLQSMRHLRLRGPSGLFLVRAIPTVCVLLAVVRICAQPLHIELPSALHQAGDWSGGGPIHRSSRARVAAELESQPGPQLAIVRYVPNHLYPEWVSNAADIDQSKLIWAREMDPASNRELLNYYKNRKAWLVEPDRNPPRIVPYPDPDARDSADGLAAHCGSPFRKSPSIMVNRDADPLSAASVGKKRRPKPIGKITCAITRSGTISRIMAQVGRSRERLGGCLLRDRAALRRSC